MNKLIYSEVNLPYASSPSLEIKELLNKFPNLTELSFFFDLNGTDKIKGGFSIWHGSEINLKIKENTSCKINKISLFLNYGNIEVYCQNFENLEKLEIEAFKIKIFLIRYLCLATIGILNIIL